MDPVSLTDANLKLGPPAGWTDEQCMTIDAYAGEDVNGKFVVTGWMPDDKDRERIAKGGIVWLKFTGVLGANGKPTMMPACVYTADPVEEEAKEQEPDAAAGSAIASPAQTEDNGTN